MMSKSASRIYIAIISGISTYFAFPFLSLFLARRVLMRITSGLSALFGPISPYVLGMGLNLFGPFMGVLVFISVYHALKYKDARRIQMSRYTKIIIALSAGFLTVITFAGMVPISGIAGYMLTAALCLNFFFFSAIVFSLLYYATLGILT